MSYTLQLPTAIVNDAKIYASSCGTSLNHLVKMYIIELSTRKPEMKKRKLGIAEGECRIPTESEDRVMDEEIAKMFEGEPYGLAVTGTKEQTEALTPEGVFEAW